MKLGIGLPNTLADQLDRKLLLDWARRAENAGFELLATIDKPNYDSWEPLVTLAAAAAVTERIKLATTILQLPNRNEVLVAKQSAVVDRISAGRLILGVAQGGRADDFEVFSAEFRGRAGRFERQVDRIREVWTNARSSDHEHGVLGPAPIQEPGPPIWAGALSPTAIQRAIGVADGFVFGAGGSAGLAEAVAEVRAGFAAVAKPNASIAGLAYVAIGNSAQQALDGAAHYLRRYYGRLWAEPEEIIHHGPADKIASELAAYADAGLDTLIVFPQLPGMEQLELLARCVLPKYL